MFSFCTCVSRVMDPLGISQTQRGLVDPKPDVRAGSTQLVANRCAALFKEVPFDRACSVVQQQCDIIESQFLKVAAPPYRRGGLLCVRGVLTGLPVREYPHSLVDRCAALVLPSVTDLDLAVRLAAAEACHELLRRFNFRLLQRHLADLFHAMARLVGDSDRKIALVGQEVSATAREYICGSECSCIDAKVFVSCIVSELAGFPHSASGAVLGAAETAIALWVLGWIQHVSVLPGSPLASYTDTLVSALVPLTSFTSVSDHVQELLSTLRGALMLALRDSAVSSAVSVESLLRALCDLLAEVRLSADARFFCFDWLSALATAPECQLVVARYIPVLLGSCLRELASPEAQTHSAARGLLDGLAGSLSGSTEEMVSVRTEVLMQLETFLQKDTSTGGSVEAQMSCLQWLVALHHYDHVTVQASANSLRTVLLDLLCRTSSSLVVEAATSTVDLIRGSASRQRLLEGVLERVQRDPSRLLPRLPHVVAIMHSNATQLPTEPLEGDEAPSGVPRAVSVAVACARALEQCGDRRFVSKAVLVLNGALMTFPEFSDCRVALRDTRCAEVFQSMTASWRFHPVSLLSLALMCGQYEKAFVIMNVLGSAELSPATLLQLDRLVQLFESPAFIPLRSCLSDPARNTTVLRVLFSIAMLLPQTSPQYSTLRERCMLASSMQTCCHTCHSPFRDTADAEPCITGFRATVDEAISELATQEASLRSH